MEGLCPLQHYCKIYSCYAVAYSKEKYVFYTSTLALWITPNDWQDFKRKDLLGKSNNVDGELSLLLLSFFIFTAATSKWENLIFLLLHVFQIQFFAQAFYLGLPPSFFVCLFIHISKILSSFSLFANNSFTLSLPSSLICQLFNSLPLVVFIIFICLDFESSKAYVSNFFLSIYLFCFLSFCCFLSLSLWYNNLAQYFQNYQTGIKLL